MSLTSVFKTAEGSVSVGLAEAGAVYIIYQSSLPNHADIATAPAHDQTIETARKKAAWKSAAVLGFVFLITQDVNSFLIGGLALAGVDFMVKHSNGLNPATGKLAAGSAVTQSTQVDAGNVTAFPMPDYADTGASY